TGLISMDSYDSNACLIRFQLIRFQLIRFQLVEVTVESATEFLGEFASGLAGGLGGVTASLGLDGAGLAVRSYVAEMGASARGGGSAAVAARAATARS